MNEDIRTRCEKSFYQELYHFEELRQGLLLDRITGKVLLKKTLDTYDTGVYRWLKDNPCRHIPAVHAYWEEDGKLIVLEEYIQGESLEEALSKGGLSVMDKKRVIMEICDALIFLHSAPSPIIHRDIKASNIMISSDGIVKLVDYDAAKTFHEGKKADTTLIGTVGSAAPEQYGFAQSDARTDIYSLGVLIREMFPDDPHYARIVAKATQMEPKLRYQSVKEMKRAIEGDKGYDPVKKGKRGLITTYAIIIIILIAAVVIGFRAGRRVASSLEHTDTESTASAGDTTPQADERPVIDQESYDKEVSDDTPENTEKTSERSITGVEVAESAWNLSGGGSSDAYIQYCAILSNITKDYVAELPSVNITARSGDDMVLGTDNIVGSSIMPGDTIALCSLFPIPGDSSDVHVEFSVEKADLAPVNTSPHPSNSDFIISGVSEKKSDLFPAVLGELKSVYPEQLNTVAVTALLRKNGKLVGGETTYVDNITPNNTKAFEISLYTDEPEHDEIEISVQEW